MSARRPRPDPVDPDDDGDDVRPADRQVIMRLVDDDDDGDDVIMSSSSSQMVEVEEEHIKRRKEGAALLESKGAEICSMSDPVQVFRDSDGLPIPVLYRCAETIWRRVPRNTAVFNAIRQACVYDLARDLFLAPVGMNSRQPTPDRHLDNEYANYLRRPGISVVGSRSNYLAGAAPEQARAIVSGVIERQKDDLFMDYVREYTRGWASSDLIALTDYVGFGMNSFDRSMSRRTYSELCRYVFNTVLGVEDIEHTEREFDPRNKEFSFPPHIVSRLCRLSELEVVHFSVYVNTWSPAPLATHATHIDIVNSFRKAEIIRVWVVNRIILTIAYDESYARALLSRLHPHLFNRLIVAYMTYYDMSTSLLSGGQQGLSKRFPDLDKPENAYKTMGLHSAAAGDMLRLTQNEWPRGFLKFVKMAATFEAHAARANHYLAIIHVRTQINMRAMPWSFWFLRRVLNAGSETSMADHAAAMRSLDNMAVEYATKALELDDADTESADILMHYYERTNQHKKAWGIYYDSNANTTLEVNTMALEPDESKWIDADEKVGDFVRAIDANRAAASSSDVDHIDAFIDRVNDRHLLVDIYIRYSRFRRADTHAAERLLERAIALGSADAAVKLAEARMATLTRPPEEMAAEYVRFLRVALRIDWTHRQARKFLASVYKHGMPEAGIERDPEAVAILLNYAVYPGDYI